MFKVEKFVDGVWYYWGTYSTKSRAEEVCIELYKEYNIVARVVEA